MIRLDQIPVNLQHFLMVIQSTVKSTFSFRQFVRDALELPYKIRLIRLIRLLGFFFIWTNVMSLGFPKNVR